MKLLAVYILLAFNSCTSDKDKKAETQIKIPSFSNALVATEFNCVAIAVSYPDYSNDGFCIDSEGNSEFSFYEGSAVYGIDETIVLKLYHGSNRTFFVLGFKSDVSCESIISPMAFDLVQYSKPYLIGTATADLSESETNDITINVNSTSTNSLDKCDGAGFQFCQDCLRLNHDSINNGFVLAK